MSESENREKFERIVAAREAMRVWPAFAGVEKLSISQETVRTALLKLMVLPWKAILEKSKFSSEKDFYTDALQGSSAVILECDPISHIFYVVSACREATTRLGGSNDFSHHAALKAVETHSTGNIDVEAVLNTIEACMIFDRRAQREFDDIDSFLQRHIWNVAPDNTDISFVKEFESSTYWRPVRDRWTKTMSSLDLEVWVARYDQACERGFTLDEARNWFLEEPLEVIEPRAPDLPFASDPTRLAEYLFYTSVESRSNWETAGVLTEECFARTFSEMLHQWESPEERLERIKQRLSVEPDPLWISWFVETQWEALQPTLAAAWREVRHSSDTP